VSCATRAQTGAVVGAAAGGIVGAGVGTAAGSTAKGAIIGAVIGGAAGAIIGAQMDKQARELEQNIEGAKVERVGEGIAVTFESGLLYDFDSDVVRSEARSNLRKLAQSLDKYPGTDLMILGHTDAVGSQAYNQGLSERRARAAASYLIAQGVAGTRIKTRGLGETDPIGSNETEAGRQANRRVEVAIYASEEMKAKAKAGR
jgi:outer membrane protein OmpA-like peptidoglycan-associated protein